MFDIKKVDDGIAAEENSLKSFDGIHLTAELTTALAELITARAEFDKKKINFNLNSKEMSRVVRELI